MEFKEYKYILNYNDFEKSEKEFEIYCISDAEGNELFDVMEDDFITMVDNGIVNSEGDYYLLGNPSKEQIAEYTKKYGIMWVK